MEKHKGNLGKQKVRPINPSKNYSSFRKKKTNKKKIPFLTPQTVFGLISRK